VDAGEGFHVIRRRHRAAEPLIEPGLAVRVEQRLKCLEAQASRAAANDVARYVSEAGS
jgi:hypothetical protein